MSTAVLRVDRNDLMSIAEHQLAAEFITAFDESPQAKVSTPEWRTSRSTVAEIVAMDLSDDSEDLHHLLQMVSNVSRGIDCTLVAIALKKKLAQRYAKAHASDVARELAEDLNARGRA